jgi:hypothetical protein
MKKTLKGAEKVSDGEGTLGPKASHRSGVPQISFCFIHPKLVAGETGKSKLQKSPKKILLCVANGQEIDNLARVKENFEIITAVLQANPPVPVKPLWDA